MNGTAIPYCWHAKTCSIPTAIIIWPNGAKNRFTACLNKSPKSSDQHEIDFIESKVKAME
ncbi:hypothetical protein [Neisseria iguanae]|uniref:hypothetical protein n=1 Tax=Neisseria iguanae TaxID=90242 RepID=UPI001B80D51C|nr:hypothetical protein [Neisseria iguanae]